MSLALAASVIAAVAGEAEASPLVDYRAQGAQQVQSLDVVGVTVTGSNTLNFDPRFGLGVVGGPDGGLPGNAVIDEEYVVFRFDSFRASDVRLHLSIVEGSGLHDEFGMFQISPIIDDNQPHASYAFIPSRGDAVAAGMGIDLSKAFEGQPVSGFILSGTGVLNSRNQLAVSGLDYTPLPAPVPEPGTFAVLGLGIIGYGVRRVSRRRTMAARG